MTPMAMVMAGKAIRHEYVLIGNKDYVAIFEVAKLDAKTNTLAVKVNVFNHFNMRIDLALEQKYNR